MSGSRRWRPVVIAVALPATALLAGACAGKGSGEAAAPVPTAEPTSPSTTVVVPGTTTLPRAPHVHQRRGHGGRAPDLGVTGA